jgi:hypothetical protein
VARERVEVGRPTAENVEEGHEGCGFVRGIIGRKRADHRVSLAETKRSPGKALNTHREGLFGEHGERTGREGALSTLLSQTELKTRKRKPTDDEGQKPQRLPGEDDRRVSLRLVRVGRRGEDHPRGRVRGERGEGGEVGGSSWLGEGG